MLQVVGKVVESRDPAIPVGTAVIGSACWVEFFVGNAKGTHGRVQVSTGSVGCAVVIQLCGEEVL